MKDKIITNADIKKNVNIRMVSGDHIETAIRVA